MVNLVFYWFNVCVCVPVCIYILNKNGNSFPLLSLIISFNHSIPTLKFFSTVFSCTIDNLKLKTFHRWSYSHGSGIDLSTQTDAWAEVWNMEVRPSFADLLVLIQWRTRVFPRWPSTLVYIKRQERGCLFVLFCDVLLGLPVGYYWLLHVSGANSCGASFLIPGSQLKGFVSELTIAIGGILMP